MLSVGIVTYNSERSIIKALDSIVKNIPPNYEPSIVVIDNHSSDSSSAILREYERKYSFIAHVQYYSNQGFAKAHNQVISTLKSRFHVICNPDISLATDIFTPLIDFMEANPRIGICCPKFLNSDNTLQPLNRRLPTVLDLVLRRLVPDALKLFFKKRLESYDMRDVGYTHSCGVPFVSGAFMFCRTEVLKAVAGFDERYFLYFEDADLSRKVQEHGYRTVYYPNVFVTHAWERLAHKTWLGTWLFLKSAYKYFRKWGFKWW
jgi:GT2 family glycosyltransferase